MKKKPKKTHKKCAICNEEKPISSFPLTGYYCTECAREYHRARYKATKSGKVCPQPTSKEKQTFLANKEKRCSMCKEIKPWSHFCKSITCSFGLNTRCKVCSAEKYRKYYLTTRKKWKIVSDVEKKHRLALAQKRKPSREAFDIISSFGRISK